MSPLPLCFSLLALPLQDPDPASPPAVPRCLLDGMQYTYKVTDQERSAQPFEMSFTVFEEERLGERFVRVESVARIEKVESRALSLFRTADLSLVESRLSRTDSGGKKIAFEHRVLFHGSHYQYSRDGVPFGEPRESKAEIVLPREGWFFYVALLSGLPRVPKNGSWIDLEVCRASPLNFKALETMEIDAGPLSKVPCRALVARTAKDELWLYSRVEDGLIVKLWPWAGGEAQIRAVEDLLGKHRATFAKAEELLAAGDRTQALREFQKIAKVPAGFLMVEKARARVTELSKK